jgi:hypothetical protein
MGSTRHNDIPLTKVVRTLKDGAWTESVNGTSAHVDS